MSFREEGSFVYSICVPHSSVDLLRNLVTVCVSQVVMIKGETALDMRGRCSAGQKVWWPTSEQATETSFCLKWSLHPTPIPTSISYTGLTRRWRPPL